MEIVIKKLADLTEHPDNTRVHGQRQIQELIRSIEKFNVIRPIVVDENNVILAGHGLKVALEQMGREDAECMVVTGLSENDKKKLLLADNKVYSLGIDNFEAIDKIINELSDYDIPGYNAKDLEMMYGSSSLAEDEEQFKVSEQMVQERIQKQAKAETEEVVVQPKVVVEARQEFAEKQVAQAERRFVLCPNCGEKVFID